MEKFCRVSERAIFSKRAGEYVNTAEYGMQRIPYVVVLSLGNIAFDPSGSHANVLASCLSCVSCLAPTVG